MESSGISIIRRDNPDAGRTFPRLAADPVQAGRSVYKCKADLKLVDVALVQGLPELRVLDLGRDLDALHFELENVDGMRRFLRKSAELSEKSEKQRPEALVRRYRNRRRGTSG